MVKVVRYYYRDCENVRIEPNLQPLTGETFNLMN